MAFGDGTVQIVRTDGQGTSSSFPHHTRVNQAIYSRDGDYVLTLADQSTEMQDGVQDIRAWRVDGKGDPLLLEGYSSAMFSSDGKWILGVANNKLLIKPVDHLGEQFELIAPSVSIKNAIFSSDGRHVIASSNSGALLWDLSQWGDPITLAAGTDIVAVNFSPDRKHVLTVARDGATHLWIVDRGMLSEQLQKVSTICLSTRQRQQYLNETARNARSNCQDCEREYGRPEESCAFE